MTTGTDIARAPLVEDETLVERRMRCLTLRLGGGTFTQIAKTVGISATQARSDVEKAKRDVISDTAEGMIAEQRAVLLQIRRANFSAMVGGDIDAAKIMLSALDREARLFGLDAPTRVNVGVNDTEFAEKMAGLFAELGQEVPADLAAIADTARRSREVIDAELVESPPFDLASRIDDEAESEAPAREAARWSNI